MENQLFPSFSSPYRSKPIVRPLQNLIPFSFPTRVNPPRWSVPLTWKWIQAYLSSCQFPGFLEGKEIISRFITRFLLFRGDKMVFYRLRFMEG
ncbi:hypothetical protein JTE90_003680 [Oedothorax gibbosus]|uniref:Uncharacterized protein n=1 Tax=Oedothorax gibbosus TaxID=931172 RepID=A0AAV6VT47_9ARAC|nr:hypothetical protein JTE90_003680 [Oedothorax gibbosus]